ncbi:hypothetical protein FQA47_002038 [Oryzias melastigma]|uniref:Uncharacterized protein n=1 Tax=Oryzias melastigma TaxID=30732 RepID=A0A834FA66_ORYME|nr:hypothetical protein FQA47_002038 [Oryzias melastigma]
MPQSSWTGLQGANRIATEPDELENEDFEHFQDNIPGFINYFMNQDKKEERGLRGRGRGRQRGASTAGAGQQRARRPRGEPQVEPKGGPRGRPRGGPRGKPRISGLVDGENVKTSKPKKMLLQKWGVKTPRTGQGGGSVGKKLFLKTRDDLKATRRQRGCSQAWKQSPIKNVQPRTLGREQKRPHQRRCNQESFRENKSSLVSVQPSSSFTGPLQTSSAHISAPPAASHITAGPPTLHNTPLPPQEEQIDRLLDEVLMELHILPNNYSIPAQTQGPLPTSSSTFGSSQARSKQQDPPAGSEVPVLQQQSEGELNEILVNFLQSFEEHIESREACDASRASDDGQPYTIQSEQTKSSSDPQGPSRVRCFQAAINGDLREAPAAGETCSEGIKKTLKKKKPKELTSRKIKTLPLEKKVKKRRKEKSSSDAKAKSVIERADYLQHQQRTTGKKSATSREQSCQSLENEAKNGFDHDLVSIGLKVYPIRSRISRSFSKELTRAEEAPPAEKVHKSRPRKRAQALILSNGEHKVEPVQLDSQSYSDNQAEKHREGDFTMLPREEPTARGRKRGSEETSHASTVTKRPCFDQTTQSGREAFSPASGSEDLSSTEQDEVIDVETVSLRSESDYHLDTKLKQEEERRQVISKESSDDEVIDVEVD